MYLCRVAFYNLAPAAKISFSSRLLRNAYRTGIRQMSSGGHSGSSGGNMFYALMIGGVFAGAGLYAYKVLQEDKVRYNDRVAQLMEHPKSIQSESEEMPQELQPKSTEKTDCDEVPSPEVVEAREEASVAESVKQPEIPASVEPSKEKSTAEEEMITVLPASTSAKDDSQTPEVPEAGGEATEIIAVEVASPVVDDAEQTENPPAVVEPAVPSEEEEVTSEEEEVTSEEEEVTSAAQEQ
ncbi:protein MGARP isoform X2 [Mobula hypostoma]|uniref:protein MGARP isoform X2 n=1 Tax=Mobula hypostoma TaxID=723540 RepID=UPI002FC3947E